MKQCTIVSRLLSVSSVSSCEWISGSSSNNVRIASIPTLNRLVQSLHLILLLYFTILTVLPTDLVKIRGKKNVIFNKRDCDVESITKQMAPVLCFKKIQPFYRFTWIFLEVSAIKALFF